MVDFYKQQEKIRTYYYRSIMKIYKDILSNVTISKDVLQIISEINKLCKTFEFEQFITELTTNLFIKIEIENAKNWREAVLKSNRPNAFYKFLLENTKGQIDGFLKAKSLENALLIKTIPSLFTQKATEYANEEYLKGSRASVVRDKILNMYSDITETEAQRIARTEVSKASSQLIQIRSKAVGIDWYTWRTSKDRRVRHSHDIMEGVIVNFNNPPNPEKLAGEKNSYGVYNAGEIFNCRCYPEPIVYFEDIKFPAKVYYNGKIVRMRKSEFINIA